MLTTLSVLSADQGKLYPEQKTTRSSSQSDIDAAIARHATAQGPVDRPHFAGAWIAALAGKLRAALQRAGQKQPSLRPVR